MSDVNFRFGKSTNKIFRSSTFGTACNPGDVILATDTGDLYIASPDTDTTATNYGKLIHLNRDNTLSMCSNWCYQHREITVDEFYNGLEGGSLYLGDTFDLIVQETDEHGNKLYIDEFGRRVTSSGRWIAGTWLAYEPVFDPVNTYHCEIIGFNQIAGRVPTTEFDDTGLFDKDNEDAYIYGTTMFPIATLRITCEAETSPWITSEEKGEARYYYYADSAIRKAVNARAAKVQMLLHGDGGEGRQLSHYAVPETYNCSTNTDSKGYITAIDPANLFTSSQIYVNSPFSNHIITNKTSWSYIDTFPAFIIGDGDIRTGRAKGGWLRDAISTNDTNGVLFTTDYGRCDVCTEPITQSKTFATYHHIGIGTLTNTGKQHDGEPLRPGEIKIDAAYSTPETQST